MRTTLFTLLLVFSIGACAGDDIAGPTDGELDDRDPQDEPLPDAEPTYQAGTEVTVAGGALLGEDAGDLRIFRNVPFAAAPVGELRFRDPQPVVPWDSVRDAVQWGPSCPQTNTPGLVGPTGESEDCLQLNIWAYDDDRQRPVMVFIHGGAFFGGSATQTLYEASALARRGNVTVVTINYRLGALGYLAHPDLAVGDETLGNYGLKDQIAALEWVQDNIGVFGGDPGNVTVFGESAGGISICGLMGAPTADGLYHKAIVQSGVGCGEFPMANQGTSLGAPSSLGSSAEVIAGLDCADSGDLRACLTDLSADDLVGAIDTASLILGGVNKALPLHPFVDGELVPEQPIERIRAGHYDVPTMLGTTRDEATLFYSSTIVGTRWNFGQLVEEFTGSEEIADAVLDIYDFWSYPVAKDAFLTFTTDFGFACPNLGLARALADGEPSFVYEFQRVLPQFLALGAFHASELPFVFVTFDAMSIISTSGDRDLAETMQRAWTTFAHDGSPALSTGWRDVTSGGLAILDTESTLDDVLNFRQGRCAELAEIGLLGP